MQPVNALLLVKCPETLRGPSSEPGTNDGWCMHTLDKDLVSTCRYLRQDWIHLVLPFTHMYMYLYNVYTAIRQPRLLCGGNLIFP